MPSLQRLYTYVRLRGTNSYVRTGEGTTANALPPQSPPQQGAKDAAKAAQEEAPGFATMMKTIKKKKKNLGRRPNPKRPDKVPTPFILPAPVAMQPATHAPQPLAWGSVTSNVPPFVNASSTTQLALLWVRQVRHIHDQFSSCKRGKYKIDQPTIS